MKRSTSKWLRIFGALLVSVVCLHATPPPALLPRGTGDVTSQALDPGQFEGATAMSSSAESNPLWLEITGISNEVLHVILHGTEPFATYEVQSKEGLTNAWSYQTTLLGAEGTGSTAFQVVTGGRTNMVFLRTRFYPVEEADGVPTEDLQLWLRAGAGVVQAGTNGAVSRWMDQSGLGNDATQAISSLRPLLAGGAVNGRSVVRFTPNSLLYLPDFLSANVAGEVFIVLKVATNQPSSSRTLWRFGQARGGYYPSYAGSGGYLSASFGRTSIILDTGVPRQRIDELHLYNAATEPGSWVSRINGTMFYETADTIVGFSSEPCLGYNASSTYLHGDVAEVMLFNRMLTSEERDNVGLYLNQKYQWITAAPPTPVGLDVVAVAPTQVSVSWTNTPEAATTVYTVERNSGPSGVYTTAAEVRDGTAYLDTGLNADSTYSYRLKARNYAGESGYSAEVSATTPADGARLPVEDLQLWLKADAGVVCNGANATVKIWQDQSGSGNSAIQPYGTAQPRFIETSPAGRPVVRFDGGNDYLQFPDFLSANAEGEVFAVLRTATNAPSGSRGLWQFGSAPGGYYPAAGGAGGYISASFGRSALVLNSGTPIQRLDEMHLYDAVSQPGYWANRINGALHYSSVNNVPGFTATPCIGRNRANNFPNHFDGDIAELMVFDRVLTPGERGAVGFYLNSRHAVVDLPTGSIELRAQTLSASQIVLSWTQQGATNAALYTYTVERRSATNGAFLGIAQVSGDTRYLDDGVAAGTAYSYRVRNTLVPGANPSNEAMAITLAAGSSVPLGGIALWFRADDLMLTNGEVVPEWPDFWNANLVAAQSDPAWQPRWIDGEFNGRASVEFGAGSFLELPSSLSSATSAEMFIVLQAGTGAPANNQGLWQFNNVGATLFPDTNGVVWDAFGSTSANQSLSPLPDLTNALIYSVSAASGLWQSRMNGPLKQRLTTNTVEFAGIPLLGRSTGGATEGFTGRIAELMVFNRALTLEEQKAVRDGLALKYHITLESPTTPGGLSAIRTNPAQRLVSWTPLVGSESGLESHFVVERRADTNAAFLPVGTATRTASSWLDTSGLTEIDYLYRLRSINDVGDAVSEVVSAALPDTDSDDLPDVLEDILRTATNNSDTDGDGLPDGWEVRHGLNPLRDDAVHGASGDFDNDGSSNLDEYLNGTNPADGVQGDDPLIRLKVHRPN